MLHFFLLIPAIFFIPPINAPQFAYLQPTQSPPQPVAEIPTQSVSSHNTPNPLATIPPPLISYTTTLTVMPDVIAPTPRVVPNRFHPSTRQTPLPAVDTCDAQKWHYLVGHSLSHTSFYNTIRFGKNAIIGQKQDIVNFHHSNTAPILAIVVDKNETVQELTCL